MNASVEGNAAPQILDPGRGDCYCFAGLSCRPIVRGDDSGGAYSLIEITAEPQSGCPLHIRHSEDTTIYVISGIFRIVAGAEALVAAPGTVVRIPRGIPNGFRNLGTSVSCLLVSSTPGGYEKFIEEMSRAPQPQDPRSYEGMLARHGMSLVTA